MYLFGEALSQWQKNNPENLSRC